MRLWMNEPGLRESWPGADHGGATVVAWSTEPDGLASEDCARKGIEALAGFLISRDALEINDYPDEMFCTCVELYHGATDTEANVADYIGVYFRVVEFKEATYPMPGPRSFKMLMQPLSNGNVIARWNAIDLSGGDDLSLGLEAMVDDVNTRFSLCQPLVLGEIPMQEDGDASLPSFLVLRDPGAGWQIWRRFSLMTTDGRNVATDGFREETYIMVYPLLDGETTWRFHVRDLPGGGVRVQTVRGAQG